MSKIIFIHRQLSFAQSSHTDSDVLDWFNQSFKAIGPYWKGKVVGTGLTPTEQKLLMPYLHGVEADDKDFRKATIRYFDEILTRIPPAGLKLEIGLEDDDLPITANNMPLEIANYVTYRHAIGSPILALSKDEADRNPTKKFYIQDPEAISVTDLELNKLEDAAIAAYFKYKDDELKVDQILTLLGINLKGLNSSDKILKLKTASRRTEGKGDSEQRHELQRFIDICEDQDLALKFLIQEMVGAQVLEKVGTSIFIRESGQLIGQNAKEAVVFLKNPKNSKVYNMLRGQYQTVVKKDGDLPEMENATPEVVDQAPETGRKREKPSAD